MSLEELRMRLALIKALGSMPEDKGLYERMCSAVEYYRSLGVIVDVDLQLEV